MIKVPDPVPDWKKRILESKAKARSNLGIRVFELEVIGFFLHAPDTPNSKSMVKTTILFMGIIEKLYPGEMGKRKIIVERDEMLG